MREPRNVKREKRALSAVWMIRVFLEYVDQINGKILYNMKRISTGPISRQS